jgi:asparagine synthase (glutamine-hydrolysing)
MPGIIGFVNNTLQDGADQLLRRMAQALDPQHGICVDLHHEDGLGLGRTSLGIVNPQPQPVWNEAHTLCLVMEGELFDTASLKQELLRLGYPFRHNNDPELLLNLYQEYGEEFADKLNGAFIAAIWDRPAKILRLVNDRLGLYPLYYAQVNGSLVFASGVRAVLADQNVPRKIDRTAIAEFLTFDHVLQNRTLLQDVLLMPQASILSFADQALSIRRYHEIRYANPYELRSELEYIEEYQHLLQQAVRRQSMDDIPAGLLLSGGLDSRIILAYLKERARKGSFFTFTWGIPGCDDARFADELARIAGVPHRFYELKPDWLLHTAEDAVRFTDGMGNLVNLHAFATLDQEAHQAKILYKGFLGDAMMGFALRPQFWANYDEPSRLRAHMQVHTDQGVVSYTPAEHKLLFTPEFQNEIGNTIMEDYKNGMDEADTPLLSDQRNFFDFRQRVPRMTIKGVEVVRARTMVRLPFADNDLVDFSLRIPPGLRYERRLQRNAFSRAFPALAQVPVTDTGLPMMACAREILIRSKQLLRWHLNKKGLGKWMGPERRPYKDYNLWFRTQLRPWVEQTLLVPRTLERGYFEPDFVRRLVSDHMAGTNYSGRLGALLALELWHRMYLD